MKKKIKTIIVDDEEKARDVLEILLHRNCQEVEVIAKCKNLLSAVEKIKKLAPDLVFLDVQMPEYAGYEIVDFFEEINFDIIFSTAYDKFALKAFELSAVDYLLKPIERVRLKEAIERVAKKQHKQHELLKYKTLVSNIQNDANAQIVINESRGKRIVKLKEIFAIEGQRAYSKIILEDGKSLIVSKNLKHFEHILKDSNNFFRSQKSWIVNLTKISKINSSNGTLILLNNQEIKISPSKIKEVELKIKGLTNL